jgi:hypothetical protein
VLFSLRSCGDRAPDQAGYAAAEVVGPVLYLLGPQPQRNTCVFTAGS